MLQKAFNKPNSAAFQSNSMLFKSNSKAFKMNNKAFKMNRRPFSCREKVVFPLYETPYRPVNELPFFCENCRINFFFSLLDNSNKIRIMKGIF